MFTIYYLTNQPAAKRKGYFTKKEENDQFLLDIAAKQQDLDKSKVQLEKLNKEMKLDVQKKKSLALHEKRFELLSKKKEFEMDLQSSESEAGPLEKAKLLDQVKEDNLETVAMERKILDLEEESRKLKETLTSFDIDMNSGQPKDEKNAKFEELVQKGKDMQAFIDTYESKMIENKERNGTVERNIVDIMGRIKVMLL
jgi:intraflagellar transport protein 74